MAFYHVFRLNEVFKHFFRNSDSLKKMLCFKYFTWIFHYFYVEYLIVFSYESNGKLKIKNSAFRNKMLFLKVVFQGLTQPNYINKNMKIYAKDLHIYRFFTLNGSPWINYSIWFCQACISAHSMYWCICSRSPILVSAWLN